MRELKYNTKQVWTQEIVNLIVKVHAIVEKIAGVNGPLVGAWRLSKSLANMLLLKTNYFAVSSRTIAGQWSQMYFILQQECIPVGCVPAEHWPYPPPPKNWRPPEKLGPPRKIGEPPKNWRTPRKIGDPLQGMLGYPPPLWTEWQTGVKILPWPKLCFGQ